MAKRVPWNKGLKGVQVAWNKGIPMSKEHRRKLSLAKLGLPQEKHPRWKGNKAGYTALHLRVSKLRGKPRYCEKCKTTIAKKYEWASISGNYHDIMDYKRLCQSCHRREHIEEKVHGKSKKN